MLTPEEMEEVRRTARESYQELVVARMRLIGRTRFDECKHPGRASLVGSRAANYRALFWLPDAFEPLSE